MVQFEGKKGRPLIRVKALRESSSDVEMQEIMKHKGHLWPFFRRTNWPLHVVGLSNHLEISEADPMGLNDSFALGIVHLVLYLFTLSGFLLPPGRLEATWKR